MEISTLNADEKKILQSVYGSRAHGSIDRDPSKIEAIKPLTEQEQKFFTGKNFVSPHFFTQILYKVRGKLSPMKFKDTVRNVIDATENLRANFCNVGSRTVKIIQPAGFVQPEIIFRNLTTISNDLDDEFRKILEADTRRDCDLRHDPLIRFAVYKTTDEEFAVLVTIAQLVADDFHAGKFFAEVFDLPAAQEQENFPDDLPPRDKTAIREYWAKILDKAPPNAALPFEYENADSGVYRQNVYRTSLPADILSDLRRHAQSNRMMLTAILQSAWGFMLQLTGKRRDSLFCQILSTNGSELNVIPVRVTCDNNSTVEQIIRKQFRQLVVSQPYSCVDWVDLENLLPRRKKFDHFLSFKEFHSSELNYVDAPAEDYGKIISRNSWDAQGMKLGAYFRYSEKNLSISFMYDEQKFLRGGIGRLCELYGTTLQQIIVDWHAKFPDFFARLTNRAELLKEREKISQEAEREKLRDFLLQLPILRGQSDDTIERLIERAQIITRYEGDRISGDVFKKNFLFVASGRLSRNADVGDGWYNPIDIVGKNIFVNPTSFLDKRRLTLSAEVLTEQAELLTIPQAALIEIIKENPEIALSLMNYALAQMERWQILWLQS